jgi:hypothetical protein
MTRWLRDMFDHFSSLQEPGQHAGRVNPSFLPGWVYTNALILRIEEDQKKDEVTNCFRSFTSFVKNIFISGSQSKYGCFERGHIIFPCRRAFVSRQA